MKKYTKRILCALLVVLVFSMSLFLGMNTDLTKVSQGVIAKNLMKEKDSCTSGDGETFYVNAWSGLKMRKGPGTSYDSLGSISRCTQVTVYCPSGTGWAKISKVADVWVSESYLQETVPRYCSANATTATKNVTPISFTLSSPKYTYAPEMDKMYSNKTGKITYTLTNIKNLANDDVDLIHVNIYSGSCSKTTDKDCVSANNLFDIDVEYSNGKATVEITQNDPEMEAKNYTVIIIIGDQVVESGNNKTTNVKTSQFTIVDKYYDFSIIQEKSGPTTEFVGNPASEKNEFEVKITELVDATDYSKFTWKMEKVDEDGNFLKCYKQDGTTATNCLNKFKVEHIDDTTFYFYNYNDRADRRPSAGTYRLYLYYLDENYSEARGTLSDYYEFEIGNRAVIFKRKDIYSQRYVRSKNNYSYAIEITKMPTENGVQYIEFTESGKSNKMTVAEFKEIYTDCDLSQIEVDMYGRLQYTFDTDKHIVHYNPPWNLTMYDDANNWRTIGLDDFEAQYPGVITAMESKYTYKNQEFSYVATGSKKVVETKYLYPENQILFSRVGGRIKFTYEYDYIYDEDFENAKITIKRDDGTVVDESDGFYFEWEWKNGEMIIYLTYDNTDEKYSGDYVIEIEMDQIDTQEVPFSLYEGEIDFYLTSQIDSHLESQKPLKTMYPPGNQRYEYYVGFYLVQGGNVLNTKNAKMIDIKIYNHQVDLDENGELFYYDQVDYEVRIQSYLNGLVTYQVALEGGDFKTVTNEAVATFTSKYKDAAEMLDKYTYDATTGAIIGNKFDLTITRYYNDETIGDMIVVFTDSAGVEHQVPLQEFKVNYSDMYAYLVTKFVFDANDNIIPGAIIGNYRVTEYNGEPIQGNEVSHLFDITIDQAADNIEKPITILPKTEVEAGEYFVYVTYDNLQGIGFINNSPDAVISKELFPEMWEQNTHMTSISYMDPEYTIDINEERLTNVGNKNLKIYNNIAGKAHFDIDYNDIYNYDGVSYKIEFYDGTTWIDASDRFKVIDSLDPTSIYYDIKNPYMEFDIIIGKATSGKYRLTVNYENKGFTATDSEEFEISGKYYGLLIEESEEIVFVRNFKETKTINAKAIYANNAGDIVPSMIRSVSGGTDEYLTHDAATKSFKNADGTTVFTYQYNIYDDYYNSSSEVLYEFLLTNVANVTDVGEYTLTFTYQEGENDISVTTTNFRVEEDRYYYNLSNEKPVANESGMYIYMDVDTKFINYEDLDDLYYVIYYYDYSQSKYIDVSTETSDKKMFDIVDSWDTSTAPDYKGTVKITINQELVVMNGDFYITAYFRDTDEDFDISNLNKLFTWGIKDVTIGSIYKEKEVIDGVEHVKDIQLDQIYKNLNNGIIDIEIDSVYENDIEWTINKNCISTASDDDCGPNGTSYADRFTAVNTTGKNGKLVLTYRDDLAENEKLTAGEYSLVLYYTSENFNFYNFEVKNEYADIIINEVTQYTEISEGNIVSGLYRNKEGNIILNTTLRGIEYDTGLLVIDITNPNGDVSYKKNFIIDNTEFADYPHELKFTYDETTELPVGEYVLSLMYPTMDGDIYETYVFEMLPEYFNFYLGSPTYNPDPLYPNLEDGGTVTYRVTGQDIPNLVGGTTTDAQTAKHDLARGTKVYDQSGNDVTEHFTITAANYINSVLDNAFDLNIHYDKNAVGPGVYRVEVAYELYDYVVAKETSFVIEDYKKNFEITKTEIVTKTNDSRMHNNVGGTYRIHITSDFNLISGFLSAEIVDANGNNVTDRFETVMYTNYIDVTYKATTPYLAAGDYSILFTYHEPTAQEAFTTGTDVKMYGKYIELVLGNMRKSDDEFYSDVEGQYLTFDLTSAQMTDDQKDDVVFKVYDAEDNLVYSDDASDKITNKFKITNSLPSGGNIKLDILPFKARIGEYRIVAYLNDENGENNISNELSFTIDYNTYYVRFSQKTKVTNVTNYENDATKIYDRDGAKAYYQFVTNFGTADYSEFSIQVYDGLKLVKEIDADFTQISDDGVRYIASDFLTGALPIGKYDVAVAINGLPYNWKTITVDEYIEVTKVTMVINKIETGSSLTVYKGQTLNLDYKLEPANATNKKMTFKSSDTSQIVIDNELKQAFIHGDVSTKITVGNQDIETSTTITIDARLSSDVYEIDYDNHIIFVSSMETTRLEFNTFYNNLKAVVIGHKFLDKSGNDVTGEVQYVGTGLQLVNGAEIYTVAVIGDINQDGKISVIDSAQLFAYAVGDIELSPAQQKAGDITKDGKVKVIDTAKLFAFVVNDIDKI